VGTSRVIDEGTSRGGFRARAAAGFGEAAGLLRGNRRVLHWTLVGVMYGPEQLSGPYQRTFQRDNTYPPNAMLLFVPA
jgi:hypothetical protein